MDMHNADEAFAALEAQVRATTEVESSAALLLAGIAHRIDTAVAKALADHPQLDAAHLQGITDEATALKASSDALAVAVANTTPVAVDPAVEAARLQAIRDAETARLAAVEAARVEAARVAALNDLPFAPQPMPDGTVVTHDSNGNEILTAVDGSVSGPFKPRP